MGGGLFGDLQTKIALLGEGRKTQVKGLAAKALDYLPFDTGDIGASGENHAHIPTKI